MIERDRWLLLGGLVACGASLLLMIIANVILNRQFCDSGGEAPNNMALGAFVLGIATLVTGIVALFKRSPPVVPVTLICASLFVVAPLFAVTLVALSSDTCGT